jgi:hypothetical protein
MDIPLAVIMEDENEIHFCCREEIVMKSILRVAVLVLGFVSSGQAALITVINHSFEQPGTAKIVGWDNAGSDIPGWKSDTTATGSGIESDWPGSTDGVWAGFVMNGDPAIYNLTDHIIQAGEQFTLRVDAQDNWSASPPGMLAIALYYDNAGSRVELASTTVQTWWGWTTYDLSHPIAGLGVGNRIGIQLMNVTPDHDSSWIGLDNVRLDVIPEPATIALLSLGILGIRRTRRV